MQKKNINFKNNKGIALITLVIAVLMMLIISSIIIFNSTSHYKISNLNNMYNDIHLLNEQVFLYYSKYEELPIIKTEYEIGLNSAILKEYEPENFHIIDINKIDRNIKSNLNYGNDYYDENYTGEDIYIINELTHQIFYVQGLKVDDITYYTIPNENEYTEKETINLVANLPVLENNLIPIIENENGEITQTTTYNKNWYDYSENADLSNWARARGNSNDDLYMWVPRYAYNQTTNELVFLKGKTDEPVDKTDIKGDEWIIPDAFQNKEKEQLTGIWLSLGNEYNKITSIGELITSVYKLTGKDNINGTQNTSIIEDEYSYYNPVIPVGFKTVPTREASWNSTNGIHVDGWNDGLVIEDKDGNQFVWVPVDGTNVDYTRTLFKKNNANITTDAITLFLDDILPSRISSEKTQITTYGGFYIGRYESGIPSTLTKAITNVNERNIRGVPVIKKKQIPWNCISYANAKINAESMYSTDYVKSGLVTGIEWDTIMKWLKKSGLDVEEDSTNWGNFSNSPVTEITEYSTDYGANWTSKTDNDEKGTVMWLLKTGHSEYTNRKNIYDLAGNLWEWSNEKYSSDYVIRGGVMNREGSQYPAACRSYAPVTHIDKVIGFRVALFVL